MIGLGVAKNNSQNNFNFFILIFFFMGMLVLF